MPKLDVAFQLSANADGMAAGVAKADRELAKVGASAKATSTEFRQAAKLTEELRTPTEKYAQTISRLDGFLQKGLVTQEVYGRAVAKAEAELSSATSSMDKMAASASRVERVVNGTSDAVRGIADATKSVSDAGIAVIKFGKDIAYTYVQWRLFNALKNPAGWKDFAVGALKSAAAARTFILAAKALGIGLALGGGAAGTAAGAVLGLTNPLIGASLLTLNLGRAFLGAKDRALEMAEAARTGATSIEELNNTLGTVQARQIDNLAFAMDELDASATRSDKAFSGLSDTFVAPFLGAFAAIRSGMAGMENGFASTIDGIASITGPIGQALAPFGTLIGTIAEGALKLVGVLGQVVGAVLKVGGIITQVVLSPVIVGFANFADTIRAGMNSAFSAVTSFFDGFDKRLERFRQFMSKVPVIGGAFAGGKPAAAAGGQPAAMESVAEGAKAVEMEMEAVSSAVASQERQLSSAIEKASEYGQVGFDAAVQYQEQLRSLERQLDAGILNETSFGDAADDARKKFEGQIEAIRDRNKALAAQADEDRKADQAQQQAMTRATDSFFKNTKAASEYGQAGVMAAHQYEVGLTDLNKQLEDGRINEETYGREAGKLGDQFGLQMEAISLQRTQMDALSGRSNEALKVGDIRSSEGISAYMALATGREDPAVAEYRKSNEKLSAIIQELRAQNVSPAVILGGAEG